MVVMPVTAPTEVEGNARRAVVGIAPIATMPTAMAVPVVPPAPAVRYLLCSRRSLGLNASSAPRVLPKLGRPPYGQLVTLVGRFKS